MKPAGVILAGGLARRMGGGDKGERMLEGEPLLDHVLRRFRGQVDALAINANGDPTRFSAYGLRVIADAAPDHPGPLAGVLAAMDWAAGEGATHVATAPVDAPFLPDDLVTRLVAAAAAADTPLACAESAGRTHPVVGLWPVALAADLRAALIGEGVRKIDRWTARHGCAAAQWESEPVDPFFNANAPDDLAAAARALRQIKRI